MKTRNIISIILSLLATIVPSILTTLSLGGNDGLGVIFILFVTLYPAVAIIIGILSGIKKLQWYIPLINAAIFLVVYTIFMTFDPTLLIAAVIYAVIGLVAAYITNLISNKKQNEN